LKKIWYYLHLVGKGFILLLKRLVGGVKNNMSALMMTVGGLLIPLGFYFIVEYEPLLWYGRIAIVLGIICWGIAVRVVHNEEKESKKQNNEILNLLASISKSAEGLREDARSKSN